MELNSGDDLISLKNSIRGHYSPSAESIHSFANADQYGRYNGLTIDSLPFDWQAVVQHDQAITATVADLEPGQLIEDLQLQECVFRAIIPTAEQWQVPVRSLQILQQVCKRCKEDEVADLVSLECFPETLKWKTLKLEAPALRSDHGTDCRRLARRAKAFMKEPLPDHRLPLHPADVDKGEGLEFPESLAQMDKEQMRTLEQEHLAVSKDTLLYLMQSLKSDLTDQDQRDLLEAVSIYHGVGARDHLTPPLSPLATTYPEYFVPGDDACELPPPSEPSSRLSEDIEAAESRIFETDFEFWADAMENDDSPESHEDIDISEMIRAGKFRPHVPPSSPLPVPRDLMIDVPLLPYSDDNADALAVTRVLAPNDLAEAKELVVSSDTSSGSDGPTGQLVALFQKSATTVMRQAEQEKLQPLDAIVRVSVPVLDFSIPVPEWEQRLWEAKAMFRWIQKNTDVDWQGRKWTHNRAAEQRMVWTPLAHMEEKKLVEQIEVDVGVLDFFLKRGRDDEVLTSADYVYKEPGLAVLRVSEDEEDDEEEILSPLDCSGQPSPRQFQDGSWVETATCLSQSTSPLQRSPQQRGPSVAANTAPPPADLTTLLSGRKRLIDETLEKTQSTGKQSRLATASPGISATDIIDPSLIPSTNVLRGFMSEYTDFAPLVDNFVEMNFPKKPKLTHSTLFAPPSIILTPQLNKADEAAKLMPPPPKPIPALAPPITQPSIPPRIVVSSTTSPQLTQRLKTLLPTIELIPRNPDTHRPPGWRPGTRSPNLDEADLVVSPATGILLTTMIKLRQRPVPGQVIVAGHPNNSNTNTTDFRRVVENVAARHERLVVLVSEGNKHSETASPLSQSDARALAEFQGFAAGLCHTTADVRVVYVGGGVETLAKWVAAVVCEYHAREVVAVPGVREMLLPVETFWEAFLRRAGLNVFAAQVVLGRLKVLGDRPAVGGEDGQVFGLPLFVMMSRERRIELFGEVFGGRRVLDRVSDVLDEPWGQPAVDDGGFGPELAHWGGLPPGAL